MVRKINQQLVALRAELWDGIKLAISFVDLIEGTIFYTLQEPNTHRMNVGIWKEKSI